MNDLQIKYALALAEIKNFSEVARQLYVSQPAISKQIAALEHELGIAIFKRTKRNVYITDAGQIIIDTLKITQSLQEKSIKEAKRLQLGTAKEIRLGFLQGLDIGNAIAPSLTLFNKEYPDVDISISYNSHAEMNQSLQKGDLDVVISLEDEILSHENLEFVNLCEYDNVIVVHKNHPIAHKEHLVRDDLCHELFMVASSEGAKGFPNYIDKLCEKFGITPNAIQYLPDTESLFLNVEAGLGVAYLSKSPRIANNQSLKLYKVDDEKQKIVAAWVKNREQYEIRVFIDYLIDASITSKDNADIK